MARQWLHSAVLVAATAALLPLASAAPNTIHSNSNSSTSLPIVDLGYELQQANAFQPVGNYYNFSNIRFAAPPTGENRFRAPVAPAINRTHVQVGSPRRLCAQANPSWETITAEYLPKYLGEGQTQFNASSFPTSNSTALPVQDSATTEDCLFLDVMVPKAIFDKRGRGHGAPVLVWIFGGGYVGGSKDGSGNPAGLLQRSESGGDSGVIYVGLNYRLGAFGWLSGPTFQEDGTANAGLHDQRFALEWVQAHIATFGGDPTRVTVFGQSAGGGSIMHQITAYGGYKGKAPFAQAVVQSPGWYPTPSNVQQEQTFNDFLARANVSSLADARKLSFETLQTANIRQIAASAYGTFAYGPAVDGDFAPALPGDLLLHGQYDTSLRLMLGHNGDEGLLFASPFISNNTAFTEFVLAFLPGLIGFPSVLSYITETLYPPIFDGSQAQGYKDEIARAAALISEVTFTCNTFYLDKAYQNTTYSYYFTIPPALHGADVPYTYYDGDSSSVIAPDIALALQSYITSFAETGSPNREGVPYFVMYGKNATVQDLGAGGISERMDPAATYRCNWWQKALYF